MRVVPVLDLAGGVAVHAVRGHRERYLPVCSRLAESADPVALARGFRSLGADELYVADLDAIGGGSPQHEAIAALARHSRVMLDAGASEAGQAQALLELGVEAVVIGTETLSGVGALARLTAELTRARLILSLDLQARRVVARDSNLSGLRALDAVSALRGVAPRELIVLDLARVGSGEGPDVELMMELHARFPDLELLSGGGVRDVDDLRALARAGVSGALVGTALHTGAIGAAELRALGCASSG